MDKVYIKGLKTDAVIGVYDWERDIRQTLVLDLELASDNRAAAANDAIEDAVDYDAISGRILAYVADSEFELIETLAERVAEIVMREFSIPWVRIKLGKPTGGGIHRTHGHDILAKHAVFGSTKFDRRSTFADHCMRYRDRRIYPIQWRC